MSIMMNEYYRHKEFGLVRTVARAKDIKDKSTKIMYCGVQPGGLAGEMLLEEEASFLKNIKF